MVLSCFPSDCTRLALLLLYIFSFFPCSASSQFPSWFATIRQLAWWQVDFTLLLCLAYSIA